MFGVCEVPQHVQAERAVVVQDPVDALQVQDVSLQLAQRLRVPGAAVVLQVRVDHTVHFL